MATYQFESLVKTSEGEELFDCSIRKLNNSYSDFQAYKQLIKQLTTQFKEYSYETYKSIIETMDNNFQLIYVCELKNSMVLGTIKIIIERKLYAENCCVGHIEDVVVDEKYRGLGLGRKLVNYAVNICKNWPCYKIKLYCNKNNVTFYEKSGFHVDCVDMCKRFDTNSIQT